MGKVVLMLTETKNASVRNMSDKFIMQQSSKKITDYIKQIRPLRLVPFSLGKD